MRLLQLLIVLNCSFLSFGQNYLNDTSIYHGTNCVYTASISVDSGTFVMGSIITSEHSSEYQLLLCFYPNDGEPEVILSDYDTLNSQAQLGSIHDMIINENGNIVYYYQNCDSSLCYPRIKEIDFAGNIISDVNYKSLFDSLNLSMSGYNDVLQKEYDSSYVASASCGYNNTHSVSLYLHFDKNFILLDTEMFIDSLTSWYYSYAEIVELDDGNILYSVFNLNNLPPNELDHRLLLVEISSSDEILQSITYEDIEDEITLPRGFTKTDDGGYVFAYIGEQWVDWLTFENYHYICKIDSNYNVVWKTKVHEESGLSYSQFTWNQSIKVTADGNYIMGGAYPRPDADTLLIGSSSLLVKFDDNGVIHWQRYIHLPLDSVEDNPVVEIKNVINSLDGGYVMVGQVIDYDLLNLGLPGQKGYIVKTNCLGFLGEPSASANFKLEDEFNVEFYNTSMQAGSYTWDFGDGQSLTTDEYTDTISHTYSSFGTSAGSVTNTYEVMLIAHGCNGRADTTSFTVSPVLHTDPTVVTDGNGFFSIFPNPVLSGTELYVYLNGLDPSKGDVRLDAYSSNGKLALRIPLTANEGTYSVNSSLAGGVYLLALFQGDEFLQQQKLIVE